MTAVKQNHWLDLYGNKEHYRWQSSLYDGRTTYHRPLGLVELTFDTDGRYYEGRADMNIRLDLSIHTTLSKDALHDRIRLAWATLGCQNPLIRSRAVKRATWMPYAVGLDQDVYFAVDLPSSAQDAIAQTGVSVILLDDHFTNVDAFDFYLHAQNCARVVDAERCLMKLFVFPVDIQATGETMLRFALIGSHQIQDGLSNHVWLQEFIKLLNVPSLDLTSQLEDAIRPIRWQASLPLPQESLYPLVSGSRARQRWYWLLTRILRHVRSPLPAGFPNPLLRRSMPTSATTLSSVYSPALEYSRPPLLNTYLCVAKTSKMATERLQDICRIAPAVSVGAECFALAALLMMEFYERLEPDIPLEDREPFITGFPLNPRPFLSHPGKPNSLMLAFSDGILLPFLPSHLPLAGRLRLLARRADAQLSSYQKRTRLPSQTSVLHYMSSRGPGRVLAIQYLSSLERINLILPPEHRRPGPGPQGAYPMRPNTTVQTCGVSSVGKRETLRGMYDLEAAKREGKDFAADFRHSNAGVRAREGEFLVGVGGSEDGLWANVSVDVTRVDPVLVEEWRQRFESVLEEDDQEAAKSAKL
nr:hypothetical protein B0A51_06514 [Rachicladosporium sp. CCFEE 5018]OQO25694.1 hypothetical protein B0A51_07256 [Rachicladosporium sp. CCFEE 5018]